MRLAAKQAKFTAIVATTEEGVVSDDDDGMQYQKERSVAANA